MNRFDDPRSRRSEELAFDAERATRAGDTETARDLYAEAAQLEEAVAAELDLSEPRVQSALAISSGALWFKAGRFARVQTLARHWLSVGAVDADGELELRDLVARAARAAETSLDVPNGYVPTAEASQYWAIRDQIEANRACGETVPPTLAVELNSLWRQLGPDDKQAIDAEHAALKSLEDTGEFQSVEVDVELDQAEKSGRPRKTIAGR